MEKDGGEFGEKANEKEKEKEKEKRMDDERRNEKEREKRDGFTSDGNGGRVQGSR